MSRIVKPLLFVAIAGISIYAWAAEKYLGKVISAWESDAGILARNNYLVDSGYSAFQVPCNSLISVQCNADTYVGVFDTPLTGVTSTTGVLVGANMLLPTSTGACPGPNGLTIPSTLADGGPTTITGIYGSFVSIGSALTDGGFSTCKVFSRKGNE